MAELYEECGSYPQVIDILKADKTLDESVRRVALQLVDTLRRKRAEELLDGTLLVLLSPGGDIDEYRVALKKVEEARELVPENQRAHFALGIAQYRVGAYEDALETLRRYDERDPAELDYIAGGFLAMTLHQLGQQEAAKDYLRQLCEDKKSQLILNEASELISGENEDK